MNNTEFKKGDNVTFHAYKNNEPIKAIVSEVLENPLSFIKNDNRVFYKLTGINTPLLSECTGKCIVESKFFNLTEFSFK